MEVTESGREVVPMFGNPSFSGDLDPRLERAMAVAMETRQITPLLKEELRLTIMSRRLAAGKDDIRGLFTRPKSYDLTPGEVEKREKRKCQNKMAARRHRRKSKSELQDLSQELEKQEKIKLELNLEYQRLSTEKRALLTDLLAQHNGLAVSCDHCENEAGCATMKTWLNVTGTINIDSSMFTIIQWEETVPSESGSQPEAAE